jgi:hypothetical protein
MKTFYGKLGAVFKQSVYKDLFDNLHLANENLHGLVDVAEETREREISHTRSLRFQTLQSARERAKSLYRSIIGTQNWSCTTKLVTCGPLYARLPRIPRAREGQSSI